MEGRILRFFLTTILLLPAVPVWGFYPYFAGGPSMGMMHCPAHYHSDGSSRSRASEDIAEDCEEDRERLQDTEDIIKEGLLIDFDRDKVFYDPDCANEDADKSLKQMLDSSRICCEPSRRSRGRARRGVTGIYKAFPYLAQILIPSLPTAHAQQRPKDSGGGSGTGDSDADSVGCIEISAGATCDTRGVMGRKCCCPNGTEVSHEEQCPNSPPPPPPPAPDADPDPITTDTPSTGSTDEPSEGQPDTPPDQTPPDDPPELSCSCCKATGAAGSGELVPITNDSPEGCNQAYCDSCKLSCPRPPADSADPGDTPATPAPECVPQTVCCCPESEQDNCNNCIDQGNGRSQRTQNCITLDLSQICDILEKYTEEGSQFADNCSQYLREYREDKNALNRCNARLNEARRYERNRDRRASRRGGRAYRENRGRDGAWDCPTCHTHSQRGLGWKLLLAGALDATAGYFQHRSHKNAVRHAASIQQQPPPAPGYGFPLVGSVLYGSTLAGSGFACAAGHPGYGGLYRQGPFGAFNPYGIPVMPYGYGFPNPYMHGSFGMPPFGFGGHQGFNPLLQGRFGNPYQMGGMMLPLGMNPYNPYGGFGMGGGGLGFGGPGMGGLGMGGLGLGGQFGMGLPGMFGGGIPGYPGMIPGGGMFGHPSMFPQGNLGMQYQMRLYQQHIQLQREFQAAQMQRQQTVFALQMEIQQLINRLHQVQYGGGYLGGSMGVHLGGRSGPGGGHLRYGNQRPRMGRNPRYNHRIPRGRQNRLGSGRRNRSPQSEQSNCPPGMVYVPCGFSGPCPNAGCQPIQ